MSEWDAYAETWDQNEDVRRFSEKAFASLEKHLPKDNWADMRVLDFGAGTGLLTEKIAPLVKHVVAVDVSKKMTAVLMKKKLGNVTFDTHEISLERVRTHKLFAEKFDLVVASSVCSFLSDFQSFLKIVKELLTSEGTFIQWDWEKQKKDQKFSFGQHEILNAYLTVQMTPIFVGTAFSLSGPEGKAPVLVGIAKLPGLKSNKTER